MSPLWALLLVGAWTGTGEEPSLREASGVVRLGSELWVVGDEHPGTLFVIPVRDGGRRWTLVPDTCRVVTWPLAGKAADLEAVEVLADGRVVILSERRAALFTEEGQLVRYDESLRKKEGRGLEGLAVRTTDPGHSRVAVLWEGGEQAPRILVHELEPQAFSRTLNEADLTVVTLAVPARGKRASVTRATDLVWQPTDQGDDAFLVLMQTVNPEDKRSARHSWLQRFDDQGRAQGVPLDLRDHVPGYLAMANWEGMDWFVEGQQLILVHDQPPDDPPVAVVVTLPERW